jgi:hypothetical protein
MLQPFILGETAWYPMARKLGGLKASLDILEKRKSFNPVRNFIMTSGSRNSVNKEMN